MIEQSVVDWFGDLGTFNMYVRREIRLHVPTICVPYQLVVVTTHPMLWDMIGASTWLVRAGRSEEAVFILVDRLMVTFLILPLAWASRFMVIGYFYSPGRTLSRCRANVSSAVVMCLMTFVLLLSFRIGPMFLGLP